MEVKKITLHSKDKAKAFYLGVFTLLIISSLILLLVDTPEKKQNSNYTSESSSITLKCKRTLNYDGINCIFTPIK